MKTPCRRTRLPIGRVIGRDYADIATRLQWEGNAFTLKRGCVKTPNIKILNSLCVHLWMRNEFFIFL